jgi:hypothetical protein
MTDKSTTSTEPQKAVASDHLFGVAWGAYPTVDDMGRHGPCIGWFSTEEAAKKRAKGKGWYGGDGAVDKCDTITVGGKTYRLEAKTPIKVDDTDRKNAAIRESVLAKLTSEEREALGYPPNDLALAPPPQRLASKKDVPGG